MTDKRIYSTGDVEVAELERLIKHAFVTWAIWDNRDSRHMTFGELREAAETIAKDVIREMKNKQLTVIEVPKPI